MGLIGYTIIGIDRYSDLFMAKRRMLRSIGRQAYNLKMKAASGLPFPPPHKKSNISAFATQKWAEHTLSEHAQTYALAYHDIVTLENN
jgi:hypothetical protein